MDPAFYHYRIISTWLLIISIVYFSFLNGMRQVTRNARKNEYLYHLDRVNRMIGSAHVTARVYDNILIEINKLERMPHKDPVKTDALKMKFTKKFYNEILMREIQKGPHREP